MKIGNIEVSTQEFNELTQDGVKNLLTLSKVKSSSTKKASINGAPVELEGVEVTEKDGKIFFRHSDYKTRSKPVADLITAKGLFEAKEIVSTNKQTKTDFVSVNDKPVGENMVILAEKHNFI